MSSHSVKIIEINEVKEHPNADALEIIPVGRWQCVSGKGNFKVGDRAIYIEPDYVVPTNSELFDFLASPDKDTHRLKAVKLRGELSFGLLVPVPDKFKDQPLGYDVMEELGITRYVPKENLKDADGLAYKEWPEVSVLKFDVESLNNFPDLIQPNDLVTVTEKIHGANAKYVFHNGKMYCGSRTRWLVNDKQNAWSRALDKTPGIEEFCKLHPDHVLFGEIFGPVQSLRYDRPEVTFAAFAVMHELKLINFDVFRSELKECKVKTAPVLSRCFFHKLDLSIAENDSKLSKKPQMMEGLVITAVQNNEVIQLKHISNRYWLKK